MKHKGVEGGTPYGKPLCPSCISAWYARGASLTDVQLICRAGSNDRLLRFEAVECAEYQGNQTPTLYAMSRSRGR